MSFVDQFNQLPHEQSAKLRQFSALIADKTNLELESMAIESQSLTQKHFGKAVRLFAPLYVSNECVNNCSYCGFSRDNPILRVTLSKEQILQEAQHLYDLGHRSVLLVAGEHPKFVSQGYLQECCRLLAPLFSSISIEVGPMEDHQYAELVFAGAEGLIVYQETYDRDIYKELHTSGPKKNFDWRLECPERAYAGGFRRIGVGALFGLADWRTEALSLAAHIEYLRKHCWKAQLTVAFPRMQPYAGNYQYEPDPNKFLDDRSFVQLLCAFRICFPQVGIVLSTREPAAFRDSVIPLGATHISAGSHTEPGGYTNAGCDDLHRTVRGRIEDLAEEEKEAGDLKATEQFQIDDTRSPKEMQALLKEKGLEAVWKDWDEALLLNS